jgi:putative Holliday junction resolvase
VTDLPPRVLGLDWGTKRIGVAATDPLGLMAHPVATIQVESEERLIAALKAIIAEKDIARIVVGLPVNMEGSHGPAAGAAKAFAALVGEKTGLPVETVDERLTSVDADSRLADSGMRWPERKKRVDQVAAALILQAWLEKRRP